MNQIVQELNSFIGDYLRMNIYRVVINCPYWMNKIKDGKVILRGFLNGKGSAGSIKKELLKRLDHLPPDALFALTPENIRKFAKRERIGIDCSGFVYRVLEELLRLKYMNCQIKKLEEIFEGGINKTSAKILTSPDFCLRVDKVADFRLGDMLGLWGGRHIAIIVGINEDKIIYAHSSSLSTKIQGVHASTIQIINPLKPLREQLWEEKGRRGENFGKKYFNPEKGDGVFRLKIFARNHCKF